jgi:hypothetical protein
MLLLSMLFVNTYSFLNQAQTIYSLRFMFHWNIMHVISWKHQIWGTFLATMKIVKWHLHEIHTSKGIVLAFDSIYIQTECCVYFTTSLVCRIFTVASRRPQGVIQWTYFVFAFPFRFVYSTLTDIFRFICKY